MKTKKVGNYILQFVFAILGLASCLIFYSFKINYFDLEADKIALILSLVFLSFIVLIEFVSMFIIYDSTYHTFVSSFFYFALLFVFTRCDRHRLLWGRDSSYNSICNL